MKASLISCVSFRFVSLRSFPPGEDAIAAVCDCTKSFLEDKFVSRIGSRQAGSIVRDIFRGERKLVGGLRDVERGARGKAMILWSVRHQVPFYCIC